MERDGVAVSRLEEESQEEFDLGLVPIYLVPHFWPHVVEIMRRKPGRVSMFATEEQILQDLVDGRTTLWVGGYGHTIDIVGLVNIIQYPATRTLRLAYVGGRYFREVMEHFERVEEWARMQGCVCVELVARKGIPRLMRKYGYAPMGVYAVKPLVKYDG